MRFPLLALALLVSTAPLHAAPHLLGSVRGAGSQQKSSLYLGGGYFPGQGWRGDEASKTALYPGTRWQIFGLDGPKQSFTTGAILPPDVPVGVVTRLRQPLPESDDLIAISNVGVGAQPRLPRAQSLNQPFYQKAAAALLRAKGLPVQRARLVQLLRVDLNGDGVEEVLMSASSRADYGHIPQERAGDYTLLALRFVDGGRVQTVPLYLAVSLKEAGFSAPSWNRIAACVDVNGDGKMEIICANGYYEGWGFEVYQFDGHRARSVLSAGWGV